MTELDETVCPVCGKSMRHVHVPTAGATYETIDSIWAVAHYLAHLVQQKAPQVEVVPRAVGNLVIDTDGVRRWQSVNLGELSPGEPQPDKAILDELMRDAKPFTEPPDEPR